jgi:hypothetical protein
MSAFWLVPAFVAGYVGCPVSCIVFGALWAKLEDRRRHSCEQAHLKIRKVYSSCAILQKN